MKRTRNRNNIIRLDLVEAMRIKYAKISNEELVSNLTGVFIDALELQDKISATKENRKDAK